MEEDIKSFLDHMAKERKFSRNTLAAYSGDLNQLAAYVGLQGCTGGLDPPAGRLNAEIILGYMYSLKERKYAPTTVARKIAAARAFLKFMADSGRLRGDLASNLTSPQVSRPLPGSLSISEVRRLLAEPAKLSTADAKRDKTMLEVLYATGLRASELMALNMDDFDLKAGNLSCSNQSSRARIIPIDQYIMQVVKDYIDVARPE